MHPRSEERIRALVLRLWRETVADWGFATDRIAFAFRAERQLGSRDRRLVAERLYALIRQVRRIDAALVGGGASLEPGPAREVLRYLACCVLEGEFTPEDAARERPEIDWAAVADVDARTASEPDPVRRLGLRRSLPDWLAARFLEELGDDADPLAAALNRRAPLTIRANTLKTTRDALAVRLRDEGIETRPTVHARDGLVLETRVNVFGLDSFQDGLFEVQDEASQLVAALVAPPPRGTVVDACAGAGGKTLALGALLGGRGRIWALDVGARKLDELLRRARRAGLTNLRTARVEPDRYPEEVARLAGRIDRVLVDAPCSGIGALRRNPEARWRLTPEDITRLAATQLTIARRAATLVAPGGRLVYATCTILRAEDEDIVAQFLAAEPGFQLVRAAEIWGNDVAGPLTDPTGTYLRTWPQRHDADGFFAAVLRRVG